MFVVFKESFKTGISQIDKEHQELFEKINEFYKACIEGREKKEVYTILNYLEKYANQHFFTEENYMEHYEYFDTEHHKSEHQNFIKNFNALKSLFNELGTSTGFVVQINKLIMDWLSEHLNNEDKRLAEFLCDKV